MAQVARSLKAITFPSLVVPEAEAFICEDCFVPRVTQGHHKEIISGRA